MFEALITFLGKMDFIKIAEFLRGRNNRRSAAYLHLVLTTTYDIIELYRVILDELGAALATHQVTDDRHRFHLNSARMAKLLKQQWSNVEKLEHLTYKMMEEVMLLDNRFAETMRKLFPGKFSMLFEGIGFLSVARLPSRDPYDPAALNEEDQVRILWFPADGLPTDRKEAPDYYWGPEGPPKNIIEVSSQDGVEFFEQLKWYFDNVNPSEQLSLLEKVADDYKQALEENFTLQEILSEIASVKRYENWAKKS